MSTYLTRTTGTPTNAKKWTISFWIKISAKFSEAEDVVYVGTDASNEVLLHRLETDGTLSSKEDTSAVNTVWRIGNQTTLFRDPNGWQHWVYSFDSTQSTDTDRLKVYINGVNRRTVETLSNDTKVPLNHEAIINKSGYIFTLGRRTYNTDNYFKGSLAHVHFVDGIQYDASTFGETDSTSGIWKPKTSPSISDYGNNGFFLKFENSAAMGTDSSGKGNNLTVNGTMTQLIDTPSNVYATLNPLLDTNNPMILSNGNTTGTGSSSGTHRFSGSNICVSSGKYYYEVKVTKAGSSPYCGIIDAQSNIRRNGVYFVASASGDNDSGYAVNMSGDIYHDNSSTYATSIGSISTGDILGFAVDLDSTQRTCTIYKNGASMRTFNIDAPSSGFYMLGCCSSYNEASAVAQFNFGNGYFGTTAITSAGSNGNGSLFEYNVPSGYYALNTKNINTHG